MELTHLIIIMAVPISGLVILVVLFFRQSNKSDRLLSDVRDNPSIILIIG